MKLHNKMLELPTKKEKAILQHVASKRMMIIIAMRNRR